MYRQMVLSRTVDEWFMKLQRMGKIAVYAPATGHEAVQVGSTHALEPEDWVFTYYRDMGIYLARGVSLSELLDRFLCTADDVMKGHDFAIYGDKKYHIVPAGVPVASHIPLAVGFALAAKMRREKVVVMASFGEGATSKGDFHEGLNFAGIFKAPLVFLCQNNQYAISLPVSKQTSANTLADKAIAYGFEGVRVDGNDVLACYIAAKEAVEKARKGGGPTLIEAVTYRLGPHTTADDPTKYRSEAELAEWLKRDPIVRFRQFLVLKGLWNEQMDRDLRMELDESIMLEIESAETKQPANPSVIFEDVYASMPWHLREERDEVLGLAAKEEV